MTIDTHHFYPTPSSLALQVLTSLHEVNDGLLKTIRAKGAATDRGWQCIVLSPPYDEDTGKGKKGERSHVERKAVTSGAGTAFQEHGGEQ